MKKKNTETFLVKAFALSGLLPAHFLLFWALVFLVGGIAQITEAIVDPSFFALLIGSCGYAGLLLSVIYSLEKKIILKILLLFFGVVGFELVTFLKNVHHSVLDIFAVESLFKKGWFLMYWPNYVALGLICYFIYKWFAEKKNNAIKVPNSKSVASQE